jgi:hypothetical protein
MKFWTYKTSRTDELFLTKTETKRFLAAHPKAKGVWFKRFRYDALVECCFVPRSTFGL